MITPTLVILIHHVIVFTGGFFVDHLDRTVRHYLQAAHNRGGGWEMAYDLMGSREGTPEKHSDLDEKSESVECRT